MKDVFEMAKEAGFMQHLGVICIPNHLALERFAELVRAEENEACAGLCDRFANRMMSAEECADAIRARGQA